VDEVGKIGEINPTTDAISEFNIPYAESEPDNSTVGPDGRLWFTDYGSNAIGAATLTSSQLVVTQSPPASITAGSSFGLTVEVVDDSGDLLSSFNGPVTVAMASNTGGSTPLDGTLTVTATNGVATFSGLTPTKAGTGYTLQVTSAGVGTGVTGAISVTPATASQIAFTQVPTGVTAGAQFSLRASIEDPYGNVVTSSTETLTVALANNPGGTSLGGTLSATASNGVATFSNLTLTKAASGYTFQVSSSDLGGAVTGALTVTPAAATALLIVQQPSSVVVNTAFALVVEVIDAYGNVVTSDNGTAKVALGSGPSGGKLVGTTSMTFVNGVATFSNLTLSKVGTGYTLLISSKNLNGATTNPISVTAS
jgi:hypothetical protein